MSLLKEALQHTKECIDKTLSDLLPSQKDLIPPALEAPLIEGMRYSTLEGGKRIRAFLTLESCKLFNIPEEQALQVAAAVELVHAFSLIHDDLPAFDNSDLRRGKPSCHIKFGESTAILVGDALLAYAFEILASAKTHPNGDIRCQLIAELSHAAGYKGICSGEMMDLASENTHIEMETIVRLENLKTGSILSFCARSGAILASASEKDLHKLDAFGHEFGVIYQITDDLLDLEGTAEEVGKCVGGDSMLGKATMLNLLGRDAAIEYAHMLADQAIQYLDNFGEKANLLKELVLFVLKRRS
ncbi:MAG: polyprenyl synthetase family protein [Proteobacteria bacterium]|nr:polyprenyl synthetase family protein [Pseudomonadota bacterium]